MFARASGIAAAVTAVIVFGDPRRGHPVALFGSAAAALERRTYADTRGAGVVHAASLLVAVGVAGALAEQAGRRRGAVAEAASVAAATFIAAGGTTLCRTGARLVIAGFHQDGPRSVDLCLWNWRGLDIVNAHERDPARYVDGMRRAFDLVGRGVLDLDALLTHRVGLGALAQAFAWVRDRPDGFLKAVVTME